MPGQVDIIRRHIDDALADGGRAVLGGADAVQPPYVSPTVLVDVPGGLVGDPRGDLRADADHHQGGGRGRGGARRPTRSPYGLGGAVFGKANAIRIARRLRSGMVAVNSTLTFVGMGNLPFGGVGDSGFGRIHGEDGLREFARAKSITVRRAPVPAARDDLRAHARPGPQDRQGPQAAVRPAPLRPAASVGEWWIIPRSRSTACSSATARRRSWWTSD